MVKKILIFGGSGNCGSHIHLYFKKIFKVISTYNKNLFYKNDDSYIKINIDNFKKISSLVKNYKPDLIVHSSALTDVRICERNKKKCKKINYQQTVNIVKLCKRHQIKLLYLSTDGVYSGKKNYLHLESDKTTYVNHYQKCKIASEVFIKKNLKNFMIVRANPFGMNKHTNSIYWLFNQHRSRKKIKGFYNYYYNPIFSIDLAKILKKLIKLDFNGCINIGSSDNINKFEFAKLILKIFKLKGKVYKESIYSIYEKKNVKHNSSMSMKKINNIINNKSVPSIKKTIKNFYEFEKKIKY